MKLMFSRCCLLFCLACVALSLDGHSPDSLSSGSALSERYNNSTAASHGHRSLVQVGGVCTVSADCNTHANAVCMANLICGCKPGFKFGTTCSALGPGKFGSKSIAYSAISDYWWGIAASADFTVMFATKYDSYIYKSVDGGASWNTIPDTSLQLSWTGITCNADCSKVAACVASGSGKGVWISTSSGATGTWNKVNFNIDFRGIAASADFTKIVVSANYGYIFRSTDSGGSFSRISSSPLNFWRQIAASSDFNSFAVAANDDYLFTSLNGGSTWNSLISSGKKNWNGICVSADFSKMAATVLNGQIWISLDSGVSWFVSSSPQKNWHFMAASPDMSLIVAAVQSGKFYHLLYDGPIGVDSTFTTGPGTQTQLALVGATSGTLNCPSGTTSAQSKCLRLLMTHDSTSTFFLCS